MTAILGSPVKPVQLPAKLEAVLYLKGKPLTILEISELLDEKESSRFLKIVQNLKKLKSGELNKLNIVVKKSQIKRNLRKGIF